MVLLAHGERCSTADEAGGLPCVNGEAQGYAGVLDGRGRTGRSDLPWPVERSRLGVSYGHRPERQRDSGAFPKTGGSNAKRASAQLPAIKGATGNRANMGSNPVRHLQWRVA